MCPIAFDFMNFFLSLLFIYFVISTCTSSLLIIWRVFFNRIKYLLTEYCAEPWGLGSEGSELSSSALQVRSLGSDALSLNPAFLFPLCPNVSVWWFGDGCLTHALPCSVASLGQRQGHRSLKQKGRWRPLQPPPAFPPAVLMGPCRTHPVLPRLVPGSHSHILSLLSEVHWCSSGA